MGGGDLPRVEGYASWIEHTRDPNGKVSKTPVSLKDAQIGRCARGCRECQAASLALCRKRLRSQQRRCKLSAAAQLRCNLAPTITPRLKGTRGTCQGWASGSSARYEPCRYREGLRSPADPCLSLRRRCRTSASRSETVQQTGRGS